MRSGKETERAREKEVRAGVKLVKMFHLEILEK
jgi:hypothetical protein